MVEIQNKTFTSVLVAILCLNVIVGVYMLLMKGALITIPGLILSGLILVLLYLKDEYLVLTIKIWSGLLILGALAGLLGSCSAWVNSSMGGTEFGPEDYGILKLFYNLLMLVVGVYCFQGSRRYIVEKKSESDASATGQ